MADQLQTPAAPAKTSGLSVSSEELKAKLNKRLQKVNIKQREDEVEKNAKAAGRQYINLKGFPMSQAALRLVEESKAREIKAFCFFSAQEEIRMAAVDPENAAMLELIKTIEEEHHSKVVIYQISEQSFEIGMDRYKTLPKVIEFKDEVSISEETLKKYKEGITSPEELGKTLKSASITDVVAIVVAAALAMKTSDIHVEAEEKRIAIRFRVDGVLKEITEIPKKRWAQMIARFKLVSGLKLNVVEKPQDGRFTIVEDGKKIDVRVSTMPTVFGESLVMRILKPLANVEFEGLGISGSSYKRLLEQIERPNGMIITTGPTGSGKTTTLYSILTKLNEPGVKIITMEDPVEYKLSGINQSQVDATLGYTFAKGLKAILRQDPDIVMVGEIRELDTAEIAIQAALTGHLMISTIHTNSAAGAIPRFLSMGVKPFLLAPALNAIIGQRLARKLCEKCKKSAALDPEMTKKVTEMMTGLVADPENPFDMASATWMGPGEGCTECSEGYKGRVGIYEVMVMDKDLEAAILDDKVSEYAIEEIAIKGGMVKMVQDGILKAAKGLTSLEEVFRVIE